MQRLILLALLLWLTACSQVPLLKEKPKAFVPVATDPAGRVLEYLAAADAALARDRLTRPRGQSAAELYLAVLHLEPANLHARQGLQLVGQRAMAQANAALSRGEFQRAARILDQALMADSDNHALRDLRQRLAQQEILLLAGAPEPELPLDEEALAGRSEALAESLAQLAHELADSGERIVIYTRSDEEARWIYKTLRAAQPQTWFSVTTRLSSRPRIVRVPRSA